MSLDERECHAPVAVDSDRSHVRGQGLMQAAESGMGVRKLRPQPSVDLVKDGQEEQTCRLVNGSSGVGEADQVGASVALIVDLLYAASASEPFHVAGHGGGWRGHPVRP